MPINYSEMFSRLRIGLDIMPETYTDDVPYAFDSSHVLEYSIEVETENGVWQLVKKVTTEGLPQAVEEMHWGYSGCVRLVEDGFPVFTCYGG